MAIGTAQHLNSGTEQRASAVTGQPVVNCRTSSSKNAETYRTTNPSETAQCKVVNWDTAVQPFAPTCLVPDTTAPVASACQTASVHTTRMRHVAAFLLLVLGGNTSPSAADVEKVIASFGGEADAAKIELLLKELEGKDIEEVIAAGKAKLATVSVGGGSSSGAAASAGAAAAAPVEEKEEEEEADLGGAAMDMFGGGADY